jgi:hypothetical protein
MDDLRREIKEMNRRKKKIEQNRKKIRLPEIYFKSSDRLIGDSFGNKNEIENLSKFFENELNKEMRVKSKRDSSNIISK